jgi:hypothetical protein
MSRTYSTPNNYTVFVVLVIHYFPEIRTATYNAPSMFHAADADIRTWWQG